MTYISGYACGNIYAVSDIFREIHSRRRISIYLLQVSLLLQNIIDWISTFTSRARLFKIIPSTYVQGILICIEDESGIDDVSRQWENVEGPVNKMVPAPGDVQAAQFVIAARLVLDYKNTILSMTR